MGEKENRKKFLKLLTSWFGHINARFKMRANEKEDEEESYGKNETINMRGRWPT